MRGGNDTTVLAAGSPADQRQERAGSAPETHLLLGARAVGQVRDNGTMRLPKGEQEGSDLCRSREGNWEFSLCTVAAAVGGVHH